MKQLLILIFLVFASTTFCQANPVIGKWILDKTIYADGKILEINNPLFSTKVIYEISENQLQINGQKFKATFTDKKIKLEYRTLNFWTDEKYLFTQDEKDKKVYAFLKVEDFITKYPEFKPKKQIRNSDTLIVANSVITPGFNNELTFDVFLDRNMPDYPSKSFINLFFKIEFILTKDNKIKDVQVLNSISQKYDSSFIAALKKSEIYLVNNLNSDMLITMEKNFLNWEEDLTNKNEKDLLKIIDKGDAYYAKNNFKKAINEYEKIKGLNIGENRFNITIKNATIKLGIAYLATNQADKACSFFRAVGDETVFEVRNYLLYFCK